MHYHCMKKSRMFWKITPFCVSERRPYRFGATWEWEKNDGVTVKRKSWWLCLGCVPSTSLPPSLKVKTSHQKLHPPLSSPSDLYVPLPVHFPFSFFSTLSLSGQFKFTSQWIPYSDVNYSSRPHVHPLFSLSQRLCVWLIQGLWMQVWKCLCSTIMFLLIALSVLQHLRSINLHRHHSLPITLIESWSWSVEFFYNVKIPSPIPV